MIDTNNNRNLLMAKQVDKALTHYATVRATIEAKEKEFSAWKSEQTVVLNKLELYIRTAMSELKLKKVSNDTHTAFETTKDSVKISDKSAFSVFIVTNMLLAMQPLKYKQADGTWHKADGVLTDGVEDLKQDVELALNSGVFDLLTLSANKNNCKAYRTEHEDTMPTGTAYTTEKVIQVRKS